MKFQVSICRLEVGTILDSDLKREGTGLPTVVIIISETFMPIPLKTSTQQRASDKNAASSFKFQLYGMLT